MQRKPLFYLAGAFGVLILIILVATSGGLRGSTQALLATEVEEYPDAVRYFEADLAVVMSSFEKEEHLFAARRASWSHRLEAAGEKLRVVSAELDSAVELADQGDDELRVQIETHLQAVREARTFAKAEAEDIRGAVDRLIELKSNRPKFVKEARSHASSIAKVSMSDIENRVTQAGTDWPDKKTDLAQQLADLKAFQADAKSNLAAVETEDAKTESEIDYVALGAAASGLELGLASIVQGEQRVRSLCDQLYTSWDKILADMEITEGSDVTFRHLYRLQTIRITDPVAKTGKADPAKDSWAQVSKADFDRLEKYLGMAVEFKPAGKYDSEAERGVPQPAGYSYIASPERGSNQYGRWERRSDGTSLWAFYGQYHFMRSMFWGSAYQPIGTSHWNSYSTSRRRGTSWYGSSSSGKPLYGASGQYTKSKYSGSKYVKSDGFKSSKYKSSGGSYRGTRYASKSTSSSSRSRSYGSSSRSSGGK